MLTYLLNLYICYLQKHTKHLSMNYKESFRSFVKECLKSNHYVGIGNPNAKILLIGKEAYINDNIRLDDHANINNAKEWDNHINDNTF